MYATGETTPQLGLDLRGGTQVTLEPKIVPCVTGKITKSGVAKAVDIIRQRVNGLGVAEAEVATEGNNIVISVPGKGRDEVLKVVGSTAQLRIRQVLQEEADAPAATAPTPAPSTTPKPSTKATPKPSASTHARALTSDLLAVAPSPSPPAANATPAATPTPAASETPGSSSTTPCPDGSTAATPTPTPTPSA